MEKNLLNASANELLALAISFSAYMGSIYSAEDLTIIAEFFDVVADALSLYAAVMAKQQASQNNENTC